MPPPTRSRPIIPSRTILGRSRMVIGRSSASLFFDSCGLSRSELGYRRLNAARHSLPDLDVMKLVIHTVKINEFGMGASLDKPAAIHHQDHVGIADRRETVSDDERRSADHESVERIENDGLGFGVNGRSRFVQDQ